MRRIKNILIGILAALALLQFVQFATRIVPIKPLGGVVAEDPWPGFSIQSLKTQKFQEYIQNYTGYRFGFRPLFVRLNNQYYYSFFRKSPYPNLVIGKEQYLYERQYIRSYFGENFIGEDRIDSSIQKLDTIRAFLHERGTELVVVIAPDKASFYPEYIPDYLARGKTASNYDLYAAKMNGDGIRVLDANKWFREMKRDAEYPLIPKEGTHWSIYGATVFADSLLGFLEEALGRKLYHFAVDSIDYPCLARGTDRDLEELANIFTFDRSRAYAYPASFSHQPNDDGYKPDMLVISDSFFWTLYQGYLTQCFNSVTFWYYFSSIFPELPDRVATTAEIDVVKYVLDKDVVVILTSTDNLKDFGFGFVDYMYGYLMMDSEEKYSHLIPRYVNSIKNNRDLLEIIARKAEDKGIPLDSMIYLDAAWMARQHLLDLYPDQQ